MKLGTTTLPYFDENYLNTVTSLSDFYDMLKDAVNPETVRISVLVLILTLSYVSCHVLCCLIAYAAFSDEMNELRLHGLEQAGQEGKKRNIGS